VTDVVAVLSAPDAMLLAALIAAAGAYMHDRRTITRKTDVVIKEMGNNGGTTLRDAVDRIEAMLHREVIPRLDHQAGVIADHADRLATIETRKHPRPRKDTAA